MSRSDDRGDAHAGEKSEPTSGRRKLPVTGEVGSEGGSYADPTYQVAEFEGEVPTTAQAVEPDRTDAQARDIIKQANEP